MYKQIQAVHEVEEEILCLLCLPHNLLVHLLTLLLKLSAACRCDLTILYFSCTSLAFCSKLPFSCMCDACKNSQPFQGMSIPWCTRELHRISPWPMETRQILAFPTSGWKIQCTFHRASQKVPSGSLLLSEVTGSWHMFAGFPSFHVSLFPIFYSFSSLPNINYLHRSLSLSLCFLGQPRLTQASNQSVVI